MSHLRTIRHPSYDTYHITNYHLVSTYRMTPIVSRISFHILCHTTPIISKTDDASEANLTVTATSHDQANDAALSISAGANHVLLVHRSGQLYTWGVGASGRLGLDLSQGGNPQVMSRPTALCCGTHV